MSENVNGNVKKALSVLNASLTRQMETYLNICAHCGLCNDSCHYFLALGDPKMVPTYKTDRLRNVWKREHEWLGKVLPKWVGAVDLTEERLDEMANIAFNDCTLCGRCVVNCPFGVDTRMIVKTIRAMATETGKAPEILVQLADSAIAREEGLEFFKDFFLEQIKDMEPDLLELTGDPEARIPIDEEARVLYVPLSGAHTILPAAAILHSVGESWTLSMFDASNYGVFLNDIKRSKRIAERIVNEAKRLGVEEVIITECGHAYSTYRWTAPNWFDEPWPFEVRSLVEVIHGYIKDGRIDVSQMDDLGIVTLHDPCNLGRAGGIFEEPREILNAVVTDFHDMVPNREQNYCCGGGGGLVTNLDEEDHRLAAGKVKADQIRATDAKVVIASCDNCRHQINELSEHYELGVEVMGVAVLTVKAMQKAREAKKEAA
ncbi:MAG: (Fe-S)-binding protein [Anaerolineaceae bacterium]|nr:(Fe-S)-binding protein [Anaerolineaceae bacterium]